MIQKFYRSLIQSALVCVPFVALTAQSSLADMRDFSFDNNTSSSIVTLRVSPSDQDDWGSDTLEGTVASGGSGTFSFDPNYGGGCFYDIRAEFQDGGSAELYKVNLCEEGYIQFTE